MSTYTLDAWTLLVSGKYSAALFYLVGTVIISILALVTGMLIGRWMT